MHFFSPLYLNDVKNKSMFYSLRIKLPPSGSRTAVCHLRGASATPSQSSGCWANWRSCWWSTETRRRRCSTPPWLSRSQGKQVPAARLLRRPMSWERLYQPECVAAVVQVWLQTSARRTTGSPRSTTTSSSTRWRRTTTSRACPSVPPSCSSPPRLATTPSSTAGWATSLCTSWR